MEMPKYIVFRVDVMRKGTSVELTNVTDEVEDVILKADRKTEPQTDYDKGLQLFADILFDKDKCEQFLKECKVMGIEP